MPPQLSDDEFVLEPLFRREALGEPLEYCGPPGAGRGAGDAHQPGPAPGRSRCATCARGRRRCCDPAHRLPRRRCHLPAGQLAHRTRPARHRHRAAAVAAAPARAGGAAATGRRVAVAGPLPGDGRRVDGGMFVVGYGLTGTLALAVVPAAVGRVRPPRLLPAPATPRAGRPDGGVAGGDPRRAVAHHRRLDPAQRVGAAGPRPARNRCGRCGAATPATPPCWRCRPLSSRPARSSPTRCRTG